MLHYDHWRTSPPEPTPFEEKCADRAGIIFDIRSAAAIAIRDAEFAVENILEWGSAHGETCEATEDLLATLHELRRKHPILRAADEFAIREKLIAAGPYLGEQDRREEA